MAPLVSALEAFDRLAALDAFHKTKAGVKGLVDLGITEIPQLFHAPKHLLDKGIPFSPEDPEFIFPIIDLQGCATGEDPEKRKHIVERIREASENWGFFQIVNHGVPGTILDEMIAGTHRFFEQDVELKKEFYGQDASKKVLYSSNSNLYTATSAANWRDSIVYQLTPDPPAPEEIPACCRDIVPKYSEEILKLGDFLFQLLSEALGLSPNYLKEMDCVEQLGGVACHYHPVCPQPDLTLATTGHADLDFITVLLQDHIGGLQVLRKGRWVDVPYMKDAIVINIGEMFQLISNDKFTSAEHRVLAKSIGPRISVASFFGNGFSLSSRMYGPIKELLSEDNPPKYKEITIQDFFALSFKNGIGNSALSLLKL